MEAVRPALAALGELGFFAADGVLQAEGYDSWLHATAEQLGSFLQQDPSDVLQAAPAPKPGASRSRTLAAPSTMF